MKDYVKFEAALIGLCMMGSAIIGFFIYEWTKWCNFGFMCFGIFFLILVIFDLVEARERARYADKLEEKIQKFEKEAWRIKKE